MCMLDEIRAKRDEIYAIARTHKAEKLWVFGSCARKEETPESDIDFLVKFNGGVGLVEFALFEKELSKMFDRRVELTVNSVMLRDLSLKTAVEILTQSSRDAEKRREVMYSSEKIK